MSAYVSFFAILFFGMSLRLASLAALAKMEKDTFNFYGAALNTIACSIVTIELLFLASVL